MISYKQWVHTRRAELVIETQDVATSVETLATVTHLHRSITKWESGYLWRAKRMKLLSYWILHKIIVSSFKTLFRATTVIMPWQQSIHTPYFLEEGTLRNESFCVISECLDNDTVYVFNRQLSQYINELNKYCIGVMVLPVRIRIRKTHGTMSPTNTFDIYTEHQLALCWFR